jgi:predicted permease
MPSLVASPGRRGIDAPGDEIQSALWLLMLLVGLLLLIVCANVANLLLARSESRLRESTIRLTLGATPARIFRQQLIESLSYALVGGALGVALGFALSELIHDVFQTGRDVSDSFALELDGRVAGFGIALSIGTALLFGMAPAFRAARSNLRGNLVQHSRSIAATGLRAARSLVSAELALCLTALVAAGLLSRSLQGLTRIDLGFDPENLVYATVNPDLSALPDERIEGYLNAVQSSLEALPGVESVSRMARRPLEGGGNFSPVNIPGDSRAEAFDPRFTVIVNAVGSEVFETLGIPLRSGQTVDPARNGVVVDERFAERFFGNLDVLGRRFGTGAPTSDDQYEIIGIARNALSYQLRTEPLPTVYVPYDRADAGGPIHFAIRTAGEPTSMVESIRTTAASVDPAVPVTELRTQQALLERMLRSERLLAFLSAGFGGLATLLGAIGLAGLLAYAVSRRRGEIGLRMALGAAPARMTRMVMLDALKLIATGLAIGIPCVFVIAKLLASSLYELAPADPVTLTGSILALLAISLGAAFVPARRAAKMAPIAAMREE